MSKPAGDEPSMSFHDAPGNVGRGVARVIDASANRAMEGLRTIEEYARMVLDHSDWSGELKHLRHRLQRAIEGFPKHWRLAARDTENDCGTGIKTVSERYRGSVEEVVGAAWGRLQQSLRTLEEYGKVVSGEAAKEVEAIRYASYTLEQQMTLGEARRRGLEDVFLYVLVDFSLPDQGDDMPGGLGSEAKSAGVPCDAWAARLQSLVQSGVDAIQIRDKRADDRALWDRSVIAKRICDQHSGARRCRLIINDRADIAAAISADGVHVGQEELPVAVVRRVLKWDQWVGVSTHSMAQVQQAIADGADYIGCGPTFPSGTKAFEAFPGVEFLREVSAKHTIPAFAIGGITEANVGQVFEAGFSRVAVSGAIWRASDMHSVVERFRSAGCSAQAIA